MKNHTPIVIGSIVLAVIALVATVVIVNSNHSDMTMKMPSSTSADTKDAVATDKVKMSNYAFSPSVIKVKVGTTVTWTNTDSVNHSVTADKPSSDAPSSALFAQGDTYQFMFMKAGTYTYHCMPHPYMHGTVIVES